MIKQEVKKKESENVNDSSTETNYHEYDNKMNAVTKKKSKP